MKCASGLQTKLQQAMAMGLPVISRQVSLGGLYPTHNENILIAKSDFDFENNIELLIKNPKLRTYIGRNARAHILGHFSSELVKKLYLNTYTKLLKSATNKNYKNMKNSKVLLISSNSGSRGGEKYLIYLAKGLKKKDLMWRY